MRMRLQSTESAIRYRPNGVDDSTGPGIAVDVWRTPPESRLIGPEDRFADFAGQPAE
jgi:hypothetical protein